MADAPACKRPESVLVVVYTAERQVLLLRRREPAGFWQSVTGSLRWDEKPREAAVRELREETGLAPEGLVDQHRTNRFPIIPPWTQRYAPGTDTNVEHVFSLCLSGARDIAPSAPEHDNWGWFSFDEALALTSSYTNRDAILAIVGGMQEAPDKR